MSGIHRMRHSWLPTRQSWLPTRQSWLPTRQSWLPTRQSWLPTRQAWLPTYKAGMATYKAVMATYKAVMATYKAVMRPTLEYAYSIWSPLASLTSIIKRQGMQYTALRTATGCTQDTHIQHLHDETLNSNNNNIYLKSNIQCT